MAEFQFGTDKNNIQDDSGAPRLTNPAIGTAKLQSVEKRTIKSGDGTEYPNVLAFTFRFTGGEDIAGNSIKGFETEKLEWEPREDDDQTKVSNKTGRIGYIMKKFLGEEKALIDGSKIKSWEHFVDTVVARFEKTPEAFEKKIRLKVPASEYQGKVDFGIPNYKGFLQSSKEDNPLAFSRTEEQANAKWLQQKHLQADAPPAAEGADVEIDEDGELF